MMPDPNNKKSLTRQRLCYNIRQKILKQPRFLQGVLVGSIFTIGLAFSFSLLIVIPYDYGYYKSSELLFYISEDQPGYSIYEEVSSQDYWSSVSDSTVAVGNDFLKEHDVDGVVRASCIGRPQGYELYFVINTSNTFLKPLMLKSDLEAHLVEHVNSIYRESLKKMHQAESPNPQDSFSSEPDT